MFYDAAGASKRRHLLEIGRQRLEMPVSGREDVDKTRRQSSQDVVVASETCTYLGARSTGYTTFDGNAGASRI